MDASHGVNHRLGGLLEYNSEGDAYLSIILGIDEGMAF